MSDDGARIDVPDLRRAIAARPLVPHHPIQAFKFLDEIEVQARSILADGWQHRDHDALSLESPIDWGRPGATDRTWGYHAHAWLPVEILLIAYARTGDVAFLDRSVAVALDWIDAHPTIDDDGFAWYDMAVGLRAGLLAHLVDLVARDERVDDAVVERLVEAALLHDRALRDEGSFAAHSNHGVYQALGHLALSVRLRGLDGLADPAFALDRFLRLVDEHFTAEGVHTEHSPGYHERLLVILDAAANSALTDDPRLVAARDTVEEALAWFVMPNRRMVMFGDTDHLEVGKAGPATPSTPIMRAVRSLGADGAAPAETVRGFDRSGYFVARDRWPTPGDDARDGSYLALAAAFHSRTHKQADDATIVWFDRGREILVDAGRFGYVGKTVPGSPEFEAGFWYSDPRRMYVEATRAHNTVQIDGTDHVRKGREPYGSALTAWGATADIAHARAVVRHGTVEHDRVVCIRPGAWLVIVDDLIDSAGAAHDFRQWFHFAPDLEVTAEDHGFTVAGPRRWGPLQVIAIDGGAPLGPVRGQTEPELQGWWSPLSLTLEPASAVAFTGTGAAHRFVTVMAFGETIGWGEVRSRRHRTVEISWEVDGVAMGLTVRRSRSGAVGVEAVAG